MDRSQFFSLIMTSPCMWPPTPSLLSVTKYFPRQLPTIVPSWLHRVVALVAIMSGLICEVFFFGIRDLIALGNQRGSCSIWSSYNHYPTDSKPLPCEGTTWKFLTETLKCICKDSLFQIFWGFSVCCGVRWTEQGCLHIRALAFLVALSN